MTRVIPTRGAAGQRWEGGRVQSHKEPAGGGGRWFRMGSVRGREEGEGDAGDGWVSWAGGWRGTRQGRREGAKGPPGEGRGREGGAERGNEKPGRVIGVR